MNAFMNNNLFLLFINVLPKMRGLENKYSRQNIEHDIRINHTKFKANQCWSSCMICYSILVQIRFNQIILISEHIISELTINKFNIDLVIINYM